MPVETASDLASMFDEDEFAERAEYTGPLGGSATGCSVIVDRGQARQRFRGGEMEAATSERKLSVRRAELASVARGGIFAMLDEDGAATGEVFKVADLPKLDETGRLWSVNLLIVQGG